MSKYKYICEQCNFNTNSKALWGRHIVTEKHKTGKRKTRSDKKYFGICSFCEYTSPNRTNMKLHILNKHSTTKEKKVGFKFYCKYCDYGGFAKRLYDNHLNTKKHKRIMKIVNSKELI